MPLCDSVTFQLLVICWLPAHVQVTFHDLVAAVPVLVTVTLAVKPLPQSLPTVYVAEQPPPPPLDGLTVQLNDAEPDGPVESLAVTVTE
ncbi:hypothetical protein ACFQ1S_21715, partial [Kibdelosporangium lantanae]